MDAELASELGELTFSVARMASLNEETPSLKGPNDAGSGSCCIGIGGI